MVRNEGGLGGRRRPCRDLAGDEVGEVGVDGKGGRHEIRAAQDEERDESVTRLGSRTRSTGAAAHPAILEGIHLRNTKAAKRNSSDATPAVGREKPIVEWQLRCRMQVPQNVGSKRVETATEFAGVAQALYSRAQLSVPRHTQRREPRMPRRARFGRHDQLEGGAPCEGRAYRSKCSRRTVRATWPSSSAGKRQGLVVCRGNEIGMTSPRVVFSPHMQSTTRDRTEAGNQDCIKSSGWRCVHTIWDNHKLRVLVRKFLPVGGALAALRTASAFMGRVRD